MSAQEIDFLRDGFTVRRFRDMKATAKQSGKYGDMLMREGVFDGFIVPIIRMESWKAVFDDLKRVGDIVIVEKESLNNDNDFVIGRIERVFKSFLYIRHFDAEGIWQAPEKFFYSGITSVTFASRYVQVFSKYLDEPY